MGIKRAGIWVSGFFTGCKKFRHCHFFRCLRDGVIMTFKKHLCLDSYGSYGLWSSPYDFLAWIAQ